MNGCIHFWITDNKGQGRCRNCGAARQFPGYEYPVLKYAQTMRLGRNWLQYDPSYWQQGRLESTIMVID